MCISLLLSWFIGSSLVQFFTAHYTWYARYYQSGALNKSYLGHADQDEKTAAALVVHRLMDTLSGKVCGGGVGVCGMWGLEQEGGVRLVSGGWYNLIVGLYIDIDVVENSYNYIYIIYFPTPL